MKLEKLSNTALYTCIGIGVLCFALFFLVDYSNMDFDGVHVSPRLTDLVLILIYLLLFVTAGLTIWSLIHGATLNSGNNGPSPTGIPGGKVALCTWGAVIAALIIGVICGLGEEDYGIFNTVAGVVTAASMFSGVIALSIQRFYSYAMGQNNPQKLQHIFSASMDIMVVLAIILLILLESIGLWFFYSQLVIPPDRLNAAWWIYQCSILILVCSMLQIPYTAAIFSHEDMGVYASISMTECLLKFLAAYSLVWITIDHLVIYGVGLSATAVIMTSLRTFIPRINCA